MNRIKKLKKFLQENFANMQAFNTRNIVGDSMKNVYNEDGIEVDYCRYYDYIEIFGLSDEEYESLLDEESFLGLHLRTFTKEEVIWEKN